MDEIEKMNEITEWISKELPNISLTDQIKCASAFAEMIVKIKPIYLKYKSIEKGSTFLFKM